MGAWSRRLVRFLALGGLLLLALAGYAEDYGRELEKKLGLDTDFAANLRVQMIGHRVAAAARMPAISFDIINQRELNAMALPDGRIYITSLMAHAITDDELAFVLGHEITHIKEGHAKNQMQRATGGAILGAILAAALGGSPADIRMGADVVGGLTLGHYSRKDEKRADEGGIKYMAMSGYNPRQAADAMQRLIDKYGRGDARTPVLGWFATHPDTKDRKERLLKLAGEFEKNPPQQMPAPYGVELVLDPSAEHAAAWLYPYFTTCLAYASDGRAVVVNGPPIETPPQPVEEISEKKDKDKDKNKKKEDPLPPVKVLIPKVPVAYRVTISFRQVPAGLAANFEEEKGTAVEASIHWTLLESGFSGTCTAIAQTKEKIPWMANEQLKDPNALLKLEDGNNNNLEGTLEAAAMRRVAHAMGELVTEGGPVDHSAPVTIRMSDASLRPGDYVVVVRGVQVIAEVRVDRIEKKTVTGTVLWGLHTWKKDDAFYPASQ